MSKKIKLDEKNKKKKDETKEQHIKRLIRTFTGTDIKDLPKADF